MSQKPKEMILNTSISQVICNALKTSIFLMASTFYIVHQEFRAGTSSKWCEKAYAAMTAGWGGEEVLETNKEKGGGNHSINAVTSNGPIYVFGNTKEGIAAEAF